MPGLKKDGLYLIQVFIRTAMVSDPALSGQTFSVLHARGGLYGNVTTDLLFRIYLEFSNLGSLDEVYDITGNLVGVDVKMPLGLLDAFAAWKINDKLTLQAMCFQEIVWPPGSGDAFITGLFQVYF